jgi:CBS domain-containing protein
MANMAIKQERQMPIGDICNREVVYVQREVVVHAACKLMRHYHVGSLVVVDEFGGKRTPVGIVTDRDIVVEVDAMELDPKAITVGDIMSSDLVTVTENHGLLETIELMRHRGVRRMPVVDTNNKLVGIVTVDDLLEVLAEELSHIASIVSTEHKREQRARR